MSIYTNCPGCQTTLAVGEHLRGKKVRCKKCGQTFAVEAVSSRKSKQERIQRQPQLLEGPAAGEEDELEARPRRKRKQDDDRLPVPSLRRNNRTLILALVGCGFGLFLFAGVVVVGIVIWRTYGSELVDQTDSEFRGSWPVPQAPAGLFGNTPEDGMVTLHIAGVEDQNTFEAIYDKVGAIADGGSGQIAATRSGDRMTILLAPVRDPQSCANKIDFGTVRRVDGRTINVVANKIEGPPKNADAVTKALFDLKSPNFSRRQEAAQRLRRIVPDERKGEVARALQEALANDTNVFSRGEIVQALAIWGTKDSVPMLLSAMAEERNPFTRQAIFHALARFKDERACEPLALHLEDFGDRNEAAAALRAMGSMAEKAVLKRLQHPDQFLRQEVCKILRVIGTAASLPALEKEAADNNFFVSDEAKAAIKAIKARQ